jgi:hypothetical protein
MKNKRTVRSTCILVLLFIAALFVTSGCSEILNTTVPSWAKGDWYLLDSNTIRLKAAEITSKEFIPADALKNIPLVSSVIDRKDVTLVTNNEVIFDVFKVTKGKSSGEIELGLLVGETITLYK